MSVVVWWARRDLRLHDQGVLRAAQALAALGSMHWTQTGRPFTRKQGAP